MNDYLKKCSKILGFNTKNLLKLAEMLCIDDYNLLASMEYIIKAEKHRGGVKFSSYILDDTKYIAEHIEDDKYWITTSEKVNEIVFVAKNHEVWNYVDFVEHMNKIGAKRAEILYFD